MKPYVTIELQPYLHDFLFTMNLGVRGNDEYIRLHIDNDLGTLFIGYGDSQ